VRFLLVNNHCISDPTAGVTQSLRTIVEWLADAGHACHILTTARFESRVTFTIEEHLQQQGVAPTELGPARGRSGRSGRKKRVADRPVVRYTVRDVPVTLLLTRHNDELRPDRAEAAQFLALVEQALDDFAPDQLIACNGHPMIFEAMSRAHGRGVTTAFAVRGFGYYEPRYFADVDHAFTCSQFLSDVYREKVGLISTPIEPPIRWSTVLAPGDSRAFVTFVHPAPHKGLLLFARLADMLGSRRPDIPILVVQSGQSGGALNAIPGLDFSKYPQIMAAPPVPKPSDYFALTRILLVPSVWDEPFGRVAAEAMINGVPPIVSSSRGTKPSAPCGTTPRSTSRSARERANSPTSATVKTFLVSVMWITSRHSRQAAARSHFRPTQSDASDLNSCDIAANPATAGNSQDSRGFGQRAGGRADRIVSNLTISAEGLMSRGWQTRCCDLTIKEGSSMGLRDKYSYAVQTAKDLRMQGSAEERVGKLYFKGTTQTQEEANKIWDAIKTIPDWKNEIVADIKATGGGASAGV
jgi:glycosyltransferase involved in cell wall biosynthesis